ncbi:sensor histidine kinase [Roseateles sp. YR242]|uniref:sensor histidine kinase n=1 Tax=Roseateles sp. YR242 TaxID=1855305 RepID=UPI0015A6C6DE|nr:sensor histidine kinase [Roseateles sp. YR242]
MVNRVFLGPLLRVSLRLFLLAAAALGMTATAWPAPAGTGAPALMLADYEHTVWGEKDGLAAEVFSITPVPNGMLRIRTTVGNQIFDGVEFHVFRKGAAGEPFVRYADVLGQVSPSGAVYYIHADTLRLMRDWQGRTEAVEDKDGVGWWTRFVFDPAGIGWYVKEGGIFRLDGLKVEAIGDAWGIPKGTRTSSRPVLDAHGAIWISAQGVLFRLPPGARVFERLALPSCERFAFAPDGALWCASAQGLSVVSMKDGRPAARRVLTHSPYQGMFFDRRGGFWIASPKGLQHAADWRTILEPGGVAALQADSMSREQGLSSLSVNTIAEDAAGNIWVGTATGLERFRVPRFMPARFPPYHLAANFRPDPDGSLWLGPSDGSLLHLVQQQVTAIPRIKDVTALRPAANGGLWVSTHRSLWRKDPGRDFVPVTTPDLSWRGRIHEIAEDGTGAVWLQAGIQLLRLQDGQLSLPEGPEAPPSDGRYVMARDSQGQLWFASNERQGPHVLKGGVFRQIKSDAYVATMAQAWVAYARGPRMWIGGRTGVGAFVGDEFHPLKSRGDVLKAITGIVETAQGDLWLYGLNKVFHLSADRLQAGLNGETVAPEVFDHRDGLHGANDRLYAPTLTEDAAGRLWVSTNVGVFWTDPNARQAVSRPPVALIRAVRSDGEVTSSTAGEVRLSANPGQIEFSYAAAALSVADRVQFRYRVTGVDSEWQEAGSRRTAYYTQLPPGRHRFEVQASNEAGQWADEPTALVLEITPAWYQMLGFRLLGLALVLGFLWWLHRLRVGVLRAREQARTREIAAERERIARELHDTLLQSMQGVILGFQAVASELPVQSGTRGSIEAQLDRADQLLGEARDRVRDLRGADSEAISLREAFELAAAQLTGTAEVEVEEIGRVRPLRPRSRDRIYLIGREALLNAVIHGEGSKVHVQLQYRRHRFVLRIRDKGPGIDLDVLAAGTRAGHYGLVGMRERAAQIGGTLTINGLPGGGTEVELQVPAAQAFGDSGSSA